MKLKTVELTRRYGQKVAVDHMNMTLTSGVYGLLVRTVQVRRR